MADSTTYSVKVSDETQEKLKILVEQSGLNNKEFFTTLLSMYELQQTRTNTPILSQDIDELETLTKRINSIFVNVGERFNTLQKINTETLEQSKATNNSTIELLQQRIKTLETDRLDDEDRIKLFISDKERAEQQNVDLQSRIKELEQATEDKQALINEYKEKLDTQTGIVKEYRQASEENKTLQRQNIELAKQIEEQRKENLLLSDKMDEKKTKHTEDLKRQQDTLNIEHEKAILELECRHQKELQESQELYNDKVKSLLERLETSQTVAPKASPSTSRKTPTAKNKKDTTATEQATEV